MAKVLIAGEDVAAQMNLEATIESEGHETVSAMNGLDAFELALSEQPDLILLDVVMPVYNGLETCLMIRDDPEVADTVPIVLITDEDLDYHKVEGARATEVFPKTHGSIELRDMVVRLLGDKAA